MYSKTLRAAYRGSNEITAYQIMAAIAAGLSAFASFVLPEHPDLQPSLRAGLEILWQPEAVLPLPGVWLALFLFMGRCTQTGAFVQLHVHEDRVCHKTSRSRVE